MAKMVIGTNKNNAVPAVVKVVGTPPVLTTKNITENGTYNASSDNADGYSSVNVNVQGTTPTGTISITQNGSYDVTTYASADVNVQGTTPTGTISITQNGSYDVTNYANATVNVQGGGGSSIMGVSIENMLCQWDSTNQTFVNPTPLDELVYDQTVLDQYIFRGLFRGAYSIDTNIANGVITQKARFPYATAMTHLSSGGAFSDMRFFGGSKCAIKCDVWSNFENNFIGMLGWIYPVQNLVFDTDGYKHMGIFLDTPVIDSIGTGFISGGFVNNIIIDLVFDNVTSLDDIQNPLLTGTNQYLSANVWLPSLQSCPTTIVCDNTAQNGDKIFYVPAALDDGTFDYSVFGDANVVFLTPEEFSEQKPSYNSYTD